MTANALLLLKPRAQASVRFVDKLRHRDRSHVTVGASVDGRLTLT